MLGFKKIIVTALLLFLFFTTTTIAFDEYWYGIYLQNSLIGWAKTLFSENNKSIKIETESRMKIKAMDVSIDISTTNYTTIATKDFKPESYYYKLKGGIQNTEIKGKREKDKFKLIIDNGYKILEKTYNIDELTLPAVADYLISKEKLHPDWKKELNVFSPELMDKLNIKMSVTGERELIHNKEKIECYIIETLIGNIRMLSFTGKKDNICYRIDQAAGISLVLKHKEEILARFKDEKEVEIDLMKSFCVPVNTQLQRGTDKIRLKIRGISDYHGLEIAGLFQDVMIDKDTLFVTICRRIETESRLDKNLYLKDDYDKIIKDKALAITKKCDTNKERVKALYDWIDKNISKKVTFSIPDPLQVLKTGQGDCNEISVLFTAFCRSCNISCRTVVGLVGMDDGFYYHAWNEVLTEDGWQSVDAALSQFPADALHLRIVSAEAKDLLKMAGAVCDYKIEVIE
ncbi:MAG: transglutaminase-like domain-containing protein [Candidatus Hydrogenedentota bacterium]